MMPRLLQDWVTAQADRAAGSRGRRVAATPGSRTPSSTRSRRSSRGCSKEGGCRRGDRVALLMPKSADGHRRPARDLQGRRHLRAARSREPGQPPEEDSRVVREPLAAGRRPRAAARSTSCVGDEARRRLASIGWLDDAPPRDHRFDVQFTLDDVRALSGRAAGHQERPRRSGAHSVHVGIDRHAQRRGHHARERDSASSSGRPDTFGMDAVGSRLRRIRRCTSTCRSSTSSARRRPAPSCTSSRRSSTCCRASSPSSSARRSSRSGSRCRRC